MAGITPMLQQYRRIKQQHPDSILFFRLGDFYEMFYEDAEIASKELQIVLTGRDAGNGQRAPMCGVPYHASDSYIARLVKRGYKVAICEQMEDPRQAKGVVRREVIRVVTPGTITEQNMLDERVNNHIACVVEQPGMVALAVADISTGEFYTASYDGENAIAKVLDDLAKLGAAECLFCEDAASSAHLKHTLSKHTGVVTRVDRLPSPDEAREGLKKHFGVASLHGFGCESLPGAIIAAQTLLQYINTTQKASSRQIRSLSTRQPGANLSLDFDTLKNLELLERISDGSKEHSLLGVLDKSLTPMGARHLRSVLLSPSTNHSLINERLDAVEEMYNSTLLRRDVQDVLRQIRDVERLMSRVASGQAGAREIVALKDSLAVLPRLRQALIPASSSHLSRLRDQAPDLAPLVDLISRALFDEPPPSLKEGNLIRTGYDKEVDELRLVATSGKSWIAAHEAAERERTSIKNLKVGFNRVFGYYIEVTNSNQKSVPADYIRKQTLAGSERYITPELKQYEEKVLNAEERLFALEYDIFCRLREQVATYISEVQHAARIIAELDLVTCFAHIAVSNGYTRPVIDSGRAISISDGRHPVVERLIGAQNYVANDVQMDDSDCTLMLITGPNMAGKSTYARSLALIVIMAQMGCYVPASSAHIGCVDRLFARIGASDDLSLGRSTFMVEMSEVANILNNATNRSLVILDEVGRGTGTYDGMSLAWAIAEDLASRVRAKTIMTTHYHKLTELESLVPGIRNYKVAVREKGSSIVFLHRIVPGSTDRSYGLHVAQLAGVPPHVVARAAEVLSEIEAEISAKGKVLAARSGRKQKRVQSSQMTLLLPEPYVRMLEILKSVDISNTTPVGSLVILEQLLKAIREEQ